MKPKSLFFLSLSILAFICQQAYATPINMYFSGSVRDVSILDEYKDDLGIYKGDSFCGIMTYDNERAGTAIDLGNGSYIYENVSDFYVSIGPLGITSISASYTSMVFSTKDGVTSIRTIAEEPRDNDPDFDFEYAHLSFASVETEWTNLYLPTNDDLESYFVPTLFSIGGYILHQDVGAVGDEVVCTIDSYTFLNPSSDVQPVPEPSTMLLLGMGLVGFIGGRFRKKA